MYFYMLVKLTRKYQKANLKVVLLLVAYMTVYALNSYYAPRHPIFNVAHRSSLNRKTETLIHLQRNYKITLNENNVSGNRLAAYALLFTVLLFSIGELTGNLKLLSWHNPSFSYHYLYLRCCSIRIWPEACIVCDQIRGLLYTPALNNYLMIQDSKSSII